MGMDPYVLCLYVNKETGVDIIKSFKEVTATALAESNVRPEIINVDEQREHPAVKYLDSVSAGPLPYAVFVSPDGQSMGVSVTKPGRPFEETLRSALDGVLRSAKRKEILRKVAKAYGLVLLIEGPDGETNAKAKEAALGAIKLIEDQMEWMPKPIRHGPELVVLERKDLAAERVLLWSLGDMKVEDVNEPLAAVIYGRARWMGPLFKGEQITEDDVAAVLSMVGADCECGFDMRWLQGTMLPAVWGREVHEIAVESLGFDPESPMVKMEIGSIVSRGMGGYSYPSAPFGYQEIMIGPESDVNDTQIEVEEAQDVCSVEPNAIIMPAAKDPQASRAYWSLRSAAFLTLGIFALVIIVGVAILARARRV